MNGKIEPTFVIFSLFGGFVLLFILAPLLGVFLDTSGAEYAETVRDEEVTGGIWLTLFASMGATLVCAFFAVPFAYILARKAFPCFCIEFLIPMI